MSMSLAESLGGIPRPHLRSVPTIRELSPSENIEGIVAGSFESGVLDILRLPQGILIQFEYYRQLPDFRRIPLRRITGVVKNPSRGHCEVVIDVEWQSGKPVRGLFPRGSTIEFIGSTNETFTLTPNGFIDGKAVKGRSSIFVNVGNGIPSITGYPLSQVILGQRNAFRTVPKW